MNSNMHITTSSKHQSALHDLTSNFTKFLKQITAKKELHSIEFNHLMHLVIFSSAQRFRHLKHQLSRETTKEEHESYMKLDKVIGISFINSNLAQSVDIFNDTWPQYLKNAMFRSGFHTLEIEETHESYILHITLLELYRFTN